MDGDRQRDAIVESLRAADAGLETNELAAILELHPNTVRWHLGVLEDQGLVRGEPERRRARGRPSIVYRLTGEGNAHDRDEYRLLATVLTGVVDEQKDGPARAYEAGVHWGRRLQEAEPERDVTELLDRQGFAATETENRIEMRRCPFYALAEGAPQVICTLHHGIIDGALEASGSAKSVERLEAFVEPTLCIAHLR
jgi:predicted ArsR family transcriptional regulator